VAGWSEFVKITVILKCLEIWRTIAGVTHCLDKFCN